VVGDRVQELKFYLAGHDGLVGKCWRSSKVYFVTKNDEYEYFPLREDYNVCLSVLEPYVWRGAKEYCYNSVRSVKRDNDDWQLIFEYYRGDQDLVIKEALKDLGLCYRTVLFQGLQELDKKEQRSIALPTLGVEDGDSNDFPKDKAAPVAVKSIIEFIKKNRGAYNTIELFVEEDFEFDLYKEFLMSWRRGEENILLLYFAQRDPENICSLLLLDVIHYIAKLI